MSQRQVGYNKGLSFQTRLYNKLMIISVSGSVAARKRAAAAQRNEARDSSTDQKSKQQRRRTSTVARKEETTTQSESKTLQLLDLKFPSYFSRVRSRSTNSIDPNRRFASRHARKSLGILVDKNLFS